MCFPRICLFQGMHLLDAIIPHNDLEGSWMSAGCLSFFFSDDFFGTFKCKTCLPPLPPFQQT